MMFPHLFPYGLDGIGSTDSKMVELQEEHIMKRSLE